MTEYVRVTGLNELVRELRGPLFRDVNRELRSAARGIALELVPHVQAAVRQSRAPQADALAETVRAHSDRVPVVVIGKVNPKFKTGFRRRGESAASTKLRRGALAHGVVYGPLGGKKKTRAHEDYYHIARSPSGGAVMRAIDGRVMEKATDAYLAAFVDAMRRHGFVGTGRVLTWRG